MFHAVLIPFIYLSGICVTSWAPFSSFFCDKGVQKQQLSRILASFDRLGNKQKHPLFLHLLMEEKQVEDEVQEEEYVLVEGDAEKY